MRCSELLFIKINALFLDFNFFHYVCDRLRLSCYFQIRRWGFKLGQSVGEVECNNIGKSRK